MKKWEYRVIKADENLESRLNTLGSQGFRVVPHTLWEPDKKEQLILERELQESYLDLRDSVSDQPVQYVH